MHLARRAGTLARDIEVQLDDHIVRVIEENLPARTVRHLVDAERDAFLRQMLLDGVESAAAEGDVVDDAGIRRLRLFRGRDVVEVEYTVTFAGNTCAGG